MEREREGEGERGRERDTEGHLSERRSMLHLGGLWEAHPGAESLPRGLNKICLLDLMQNP